MTTEQMVEIFKYMTLLNILILVLSVGMVVLLRNTICRLHGALFGLKEEMVGVVLYGFLGVYKLLILVFNLVPYIALRWLG